MNKLILVFLTSIIFLLTSCAQNTVMNTRLNDDLISKHWMSSITTRPASWISPTDRWFFTGEPNTREQEKILHESITGAIVRDRTTRVANFTNIIADGDFTLQITGQQFHNSLDIVGPANVTKDLVVNIQGDTLYIHQKPDCKSDLHHVVIRIGMRTLTKLITNGTTVLGRCMTSDYLILHANHHSCVILTGKMRLKDSIARDLSTITVIGVHACNVDIMADARSTINLSGKISLRHIYNMGGEINIIGSNSTCLELVTKGCSVTKIAGYVGVKQLSASAESRVYLYWVIGNQIDILVSDHARVYLAGCVANMNLRVRDKSLFDGELLHTTNSYATTCGCSHANIAADQKLFATASDNSSIYYFGSPGNISRFISGNALIIPIYTNGIAIPATPYRQPYTWQFRSEETK